MFPAGGSSAQSLSLFEHCRRCGGKYRASNAGAQKRHRKACDTKYGNDTSQDLDVTEQEILPDQLDDGAAMLAVEGDITISTLKRKATEETESRHREKQARLNMLLDDAPSRDLVDCFVI